MGEPGQILVRSAGKGEVTGQVQKGIEIWGGEVGIRGSGVKRRRKKNREVGEKLRGVMESRWKGCKGVLGEGTTKPEDETHTKGLENEYKKWEEGGFWTHYQKKAASGVIVSPKKEGKCCKRKKGGREGRRKGVGAMDVGFSRGNGRARQCRKGTGKR